MTKNKTFLILISVCLILGALLIVLSKISPKTLMVIGVCLVILAVILTALFIYLSLKKQ